MPLGLPAGYRLHLTRGRAPVPVTVSNVDARVPPPDTGSCTAECGASCRSGRSGSPLRSACADGGAVEDMVAKLVTCICRNHDCADICATHWAGAVPQTSRDADMTRQLARRVPEPPRHALTNAHSMPRPFCLTRPTTSRSALTRLGARIGLHRTFSAAPSVLYEGLARLSESRPSRGGSVVVERRNVR